MDHDPTPDTPRDDDTPAALPSLADALASHPKMRHPKTMTAIFAGL